jgi:putative glutamine amidotransferase
MKIGLTYTGRGEKHENYVRWLKDRDPAVEIVKLGVDGDAAAITRCDALVLSGGIDIHPEWYGGAKAYFKAPEKWRRDRDIFERSVFGYALEHGLPVLGVCRGLQLINVLRGGTLIQDLGEQGNKTHEAVGDLDMRHGVRIEGDSLLHGIAGSVTGEINSAHHQAIGSLGEGLKVNCRADDGTIEGIEWADVDGKPFMLAVQWHPERMYTDKMQDAWLYKRIRDRFVEEIEQAKMRSGEK